MVHVNVSASQAAIQPVPGAIKKERALPQMRQDPFKKKTLATTYSPTIGSTIGATGLNFSVRNGKRWTPCAKITKIKKVM